MSTDSELLARIDERTNNIDKKLDAHISNHSQHLEDDKVEFKLIRDKQDFHNKVIYGALAIVGFIGFMAKFIK